MKLIAFGLKKMDGSHYAYAACVRGDDGGFGFDDIVVLGATPADAGKAFTQLLTDIEKAPAP